MRFELTTTTLATLQQSEQNNVNCRVNRDDAERLHHLLHQIADSENRNVVSVICDLLVEVVGEDSLEPLFAAIQRRAGAVYGPGLKR